MVALAMGLSGCTSSTGAPEGDALPALEAVSEDNPSSLEAVFSKSPQSIDAPDILREAMPQYQWDGARALGSIDGFGLWALQGKEEVCLFLARGYGPGGGFVSAQSCSSKASFELGGIKQAATLDGNHLEIWLVPDGYPQAADERDRPSQNVLVRR
ncbi:hypothetical protein GCM10027404_26680 [Arthrobacter tumbae]